jgi:hypothetical protein
MSMTVRRLIICCLGLLAALSAWPLAELILFSQGSFASYLSFLTVLGAVTGAAYGTFFGAAEGITSRIRIRMLTGMLLGAAFGCAGGAAGMLVGQAALWLAGDAIIRSRGDFRSFVLPVSRAIGWAVLGLFVGAGEGIRAASLRKIVVGILGGLLGGLAGGLALEGARLWAPDVPWLRLGGFVLLGIGIALFHALIEKGMSLGVLRVLTGPLRGKEYILNQSRLRLGRARRNEIALPSYEDLAPVQARIRISGSGAMVTNLEPRLPLLVNDMKVEESRLRLGDVIRLGTARLLYRSE